MDTSTEPVTSKDISLENKGTTSVDIYLKSILPKFKPTESMSFNVSYEIADLNAWDNVDKDYNFMGQWFSRDLGVAKKDSELEDLDLLEENQGLSTNQTNYSKQDTQAYAVRWIPLESLKYNEKWFIPLKTMSTRFAYQFKTIDALSSYSEQTIWPEILLGIKSFENIIRANNFVSEGDMSIKYLKKRNRF